MKTIFSMSCLVGLVLSPTISRAQFYHLDARPRLSDEEGDQLQLMARGVILTMIVKHKLFGEHIRRLENTRFDGMMCVEPDKPNFWGCPNVLDLHDIYQDVERDLERYRKYHAKKGEKVKSTTLNRSDWVTIKRSEGMYQSLRLELIQMLKEGQEHLAKELENVDRTIPKTKK